MTTSTQRASAICISVSLAFVSSVSMADNADVRVHNNTTSRVYVNYDGQNGCQIDPGDSCNFPVTVGHHTLTAERSDNGNKRTEEADVGADGYDFNLTEGNPT
jgi:uncharacterized membrane protein